MEGSRDVLRQQYRFRTKILTLIQHNFEKLTSHGTYRCIGTAGMDRLRGKWLHSVMSYEAA